MTLNVAFRHSFPGLALDIAFEAPLGLTALYGRSGSGKTTVINAVAGLLRPNHGKIITDGVTLLDTATGENLPPHRRRLGYVFQDARLFPHMTVKQNLGYGRWFAPKGQISFNEVVDLLGIGPLLSRMPIALSGGEKQRVAIGRALLSNPALLLMDEPLAALDDARKAEILPYILRLRDQTKVPILYVSHALQEVAMLATTLVVIEAGAIRRAGLAADLLADASLASTFGLRDAGALLNTRLTAQEADGLSRLDSAGGPLWLPRIDAPIGAILRIRIMAQDILLSNTRPKGLSALNILAATITDLRHDDAASVLVQLAIGEDRLLARVTRRSADALDLRLGASTYAILKSVAVAQTNIGSQTEP
jgi:molybdate transport system ATP-binding protein